MIPVLDKSGKWYVIEEFAGFQVTVRWLQDASFGGVEFSAYLKYELWFGGDRTSCLCSAQLFLRNIKRVSDPDPMPPFEESQEECMQTFRQRMRDKKIKVTSASIPSLAQVAWDDSFSGDVKLKESPEGYLDLEW